MPQPHLAYRNAQGRADLPHCWLLLKMDSRSLKVVMDVSTMLQREEPDTAQHIADKGGNQPARATRRYPIGAETTPRGVSFRVWAPAAPVVVLEVFDTVEAERPAASLRMIAEPDGYHVLLARELRAGTLYKFRLGDASVPDPASRYQPAGPHGPSQVIDPGQFHWTDQHWKGVPENRRVVYEMHVGTFTPEGTWLAAAEMLPELAELGVTVIEMMPVADFPGKFGWGYDGVDLFAPTRLYGQPDDLRRFVDRAHALGIEVILDVVYNHVGPDGNFLKVFSPDYFTDRYKNEWGQPLNFDGPNSGPVREFFCTNARYWIEEFHMDGLRFDATQQMYDSSKEHILSEIGRATRDAAARRALFLICENESQHPRLVRPVSAGGIGMDGLWNDDLHHSIVAALTGKAEAYFTDYRGAPQEFISAFKYGYLYQGQWYRWQKKHRGRSTRGVCSRCFVNFMENHDQVANSLRGQRLHQLASPGCYRAITALCLLGPGVPMLFQGQEFASSAPFVFFADHNPELAALVRKGRKEFLDQFPSIAAPESEPCYRHPEAEATFTACKLNPKERQANVAARLLHGDLLALRRDDPVLSVADADTVDGAVLGQSAFVIRFFADEGKDRVLLVNLGVDLPLSPAPEPLLAPPEEHAWHLLWSSDRPQYGGCGCGALRTDDQWILPGHSAILLDARPAPMNLTATERAEP